MKDTNIISITDIIENKVRKQKELEGYEAQLDDLKRKKFWIEKEIQMAEFIISAVQSEITPQQFIKALINTNYPTLIHLFLVRR
jgi:hypothetical protein